MVFSGTELHAFERSCVLSFLLVATAALLLLSRPCPSGMVTSNNTSLYPNSSKWYAANGDGTRGFFSERACVTQASAVGIFSVPHQCWVNTQLPCAVLSCWAGVGPGSSLQTSRPHITAC